MSRDVGERLAVARRWLAAARRIYDERARLVPALVRSTGLTPEGVDLGFASLERDATDAELRALVGAAGEARHVHVVLSANVFVAPLRAIALASAAAPRVTVRPSSRDPVLAEALLEAFADPAVTIAGGQGIPDGADRVDIYGRDETIAAVGAGARAGVAIRGHGTGLGVAWVAVGDPVDEAAAAIAADVVPFDQRGCLSPRIVLVEGAAERVAALAKRLDAELRAWSSRVPRGPLTAEEATDAVRWRDALAFAGMLRDAPDHAVAQVAVASLDGRVIAPFAVPPSGRHVLLAGVTDRAAGARALAAIAPFVVTVGARAEGARELAPSGARLARLGSMQRPPLDGPVDRRLLAAGV
jgi:hypothetical protein